MSRRNPLRRESVVRPLGAGFRLRDRVVTRGHTEDVPVVIAMEDHELRLVQIPADRQPRCGTEPFATDIQPMPLLEMHAVIDNGVLNCMCTIEGGWRSGHDVRPNGRAERPATEIPAAAGRGPQASSNHKEP